jgi:MFS transporter, putative metabolite:H+ symporter
MKKSPWLIVLVAALGYFVDAYDLILFIVVRKSSLIELGVAEKDLVATGLQLFNYQHIGLIVGGVFFGILGDKKGRISVLFGSILLYSIANIANGFVHDLATYKILRFLAGIGLAGELGAGITLVAETMPKDKRGYGTMIVAATGALGATVAGLVGDLTPWRMAYFIGGGMGLFLLLLRMGTFESSMFENLKKSNAERGNFLKIFTDSKLFKKYLACIFVAIPIFFVISILMQLAPELAKTLGVNGEIKSGQAVMYVYFGLLFGDLSCGYLSQILKSRKKAIAIFLSFWILSALIYLNARAISAQTFLYICTLIGFCSGFWITLLTMAAEQFGTNIRATVSTTIPNFARGAVVPISMLFSFLKESMSMVQAATLIGVLCFMMAFLANRFLKETFSNELDFVE